MSGGGLTSGGVPYSEPSTSQEAAESMEYAAATLRAMVLSEIRRSGPFGRTADEIEVALRLRHQTATPRCWELKGMGKVVMTSATRPTRSGRKARVYVLAGVPLPAGVQVVHSRSKAVQSVFSDAWLAGEHEEYRYTLTRVWGPGPLVLWTLANPSTADAKKTDQTCSKGMGFSRRWGFGGMVFTNLGALRATNPRDFKIALAFNQDVVGPLNDDVIRYLAYNIRYVVCAWGDCLSPWAENVGAPRVRQIFKTLGIVPCRLGPLLPSGNPRHPLMTPYETRLEPWT